MLRCLTCTASWRKWHLNWTEFVCLRSLWWQPMDQQWTAKNTRYSRPRAWGSKLLISSCSDTGQSMRHMYANSFLQSELFSATVWQTLTAVSATLVALTVSPTKVPCKGNKDIDISWSRNNSWYAHCAVVTVADCWLCSRVCDPRMTSTSQLGQPESSTSRTVFCHGLVMSWVCHLYYM